MAKVGSLSDNFANGLAAFWTASQSGGSVTTLNRKVVIKGTTASIVTPQIYDINNSAISIKILEVIPSADGRLSFYYIRSGASNGIGFELRISTNTLSATFQGATVASDTFDISSHRYLRIRESRGTTYYETSSNGLVWAEFGTNASPANTDLYRVVLGASFYASTTAYHLTDFNILPYEEPATNKVYEAHHYKDGEFQGILPLANDFSLQKAINTSGASASITLPIDFNATDSSYDEDELLTENLDEILDENNNGIVGSAEYNITGVPALADNVKIYEISDQNPEGVIKLDGIVYDYRYNIISKTTDLEVASQGIRLDNLMVKKLTELTEEENPDTNLDTYATIYPASSLTKLAQTFQMGNARDVSSVYVYAGWLLAYYGYTTEIKVKIYSGTPASPGPLLGSTTGTVSTVDLGQVTCTFATPISLATSTDYYIEVTTESFPVSVGFDSGQNYADGTAYTYTASTSTWSSISYDMIFGVNYVGSSVNTNVFNSYDPSDIARELVTLASGAGALVSYTADSVDDTGNTVSYTFVFNTYYEALKKCIELSPANWYWYVDPATNIFYMKAKSDAVDHYLDFNKIVGGKIGRSLKDVANVAYLSGGDTGSGTNLLKQAVDINSVDKYGQWLQARSDNRITDATSGQLVVDGIVDEFATPKFRGENIVISAKDYNFNKFKLGDIVGFTSAGSVIASLRLQIVAMDESRELLTMHLEVVPPSVSKRLEDIRRNLVQQETLDNPAISDA